MFAIQSSLEVTQSSVAHTNWAINKWPGCAIPFHFASYNSPPIAYAAWGVRGCERGRESIGREECPRVAGLSPAWDRCSRCLHCITFLYMWRQNIPVCVATKNSCMCAYKIFVCKTVSVTVINGHIRVDFPHPLRIFQLQAWTDLF